MIKLRNYEIQKQCLDKVFSTGLNVFIYVDNIVLTLLRPSSLIET